MQSISIIGRCFVVMLLLCGSLAASASENHATHQGLTATELRCEYRKNPLGLDVAAPRLSWVLQSQRRSQRQSAYRILVAGSAAQLARDEGDLWDTGKVTSARSVHVVYRGKALRAGQRCYWKVMVWDKDGDSSRWSQPAWWEMGLLDGRNWKGRWINDGKANPQTDEGFYEDDPAPLFRKEFDLSKEVRRARLYISGLGYYTAHVNGGSVGDHHLDPTWTVYSKRVFYSTYDLTDQLKSGRNCVGVMLGNGWYNPLPLRMWGHLNLREHLAVGRPRFIAQLNIEFSDGSKMAIVTDPTWKVAAGPIRRNSIYLGEVYDARREILDWDRPGFDAAAWSQASVAQEAVGLLEAQPLPPIKATATLKPVKISEPQKGVFIFDMGQNFGGWVRLSLDVPEGARIGLRYGELLHADGTLNPMTSVAGQIKGKRKNDEGRAVSVGGPGAPEIAWQADTYVARGGGPEVYTPRFTFHAFRYVEVVGYPGVPTLDMLEGIRLHTAVDEVGTFACSNELFNQIQHACQWTFRSNLFGVQSDCPHRERFGYGGDLVATCDAFMLNYDMANFYAKVIRDWHDSALADGMLTDTAPFVGIQYCGVGWAMAHPLAQLQLYRYYGDTRIIEEQYATAKRWFDRVASQTPDHIIKDGLSDHEALVRAPSPQMVTPLYCQSARLMSRLAGILGKDEEARRYAELSEHIKDAYLKRFLEPGTGTFSPGTQASQAFALYLDMAPATERAAALQHLIDDITVQNKGHLNTGIFGTQYVLDTLSREGRSEVAYDVVNQRDFPGWGYMLENGATTLWEHWALSDNTFSHNHPMFGSVSQWFFNWLGGIQPAPEAVAFDRISIRPQLVKDLDWVRCRYDSVRGPVACHWQRRGRSVEVAIEVPVNTTADVYLPSVGTDEITESGRPAARSEGVSYLRTEQGVAVFRVGSGRYSFTVPQAN